MLIPGFLLLWLWQLGQSILIIVGISARRASHSNNMGASLDDSQRGMIGGHEIHGIFFTIESLAPPAFSRSS
jgi:hypothetical protein